MSIITAQVQGLGLHIASIQLQDIELPEDLKRVMSRQAAAEREKKATLTKAEGARLAAVDLLETANIMKKNSIALELRTLQTIDGLGSSPSNTIVLFPVELTHVLKSLSQLSGSASGENKE